MIDRQSSQIRTALLIYPWLIEAEFSRANQEQRPIRHLVDLGGLHRAVTSTTPATFLLVGYDDKNTPYEHCLAYAAKLHEAGVGFELHVMGTGTHGFGMRSPDPRLQIWPTLADHWLLTSGILAPSSAPADQR